MPAELSVIPMRSARMDGLESKGPTEPLAPTRCRRTTHGKGGNIRCFLEVVRGMRHNQEFTWSYRVNLLRFRG